MLMVCDVLLVLKVEASIGNESTNVEVGASTIFGKLQRFFFLFSQSIFQF
jgi:hypothetical protein